MLFRSKTSEPFTSLVLGDNEGQSSAKTTTVTNGKPSKSPRGRTKNTQEPVSSKIPGSTMKIEDKAFTQISTDEPLDTPEAKEELSIPTKSPKGRPKIVPEILSCSLCNKSDVKTRIMEHLSSTHFSKEIKIGRAHV